MSQSSAIITATAILAFLLLFSAFKGADTTLYLPAPLSAAHARIEADCAACHTPWKGPSEMRCLVCHQRTLAHDSHAPEKLAQATKKHDKPAFTPGCLDCHKEHRDSRHEGYTGPDGLCELCHQPALLLAGSHQEAPKEGCQAKGCHSYHTNLGRAKLTTESRHRMLPESIVVEKGAPPKKKLLSDKEMAAMKKDPFYTARQTVTSRYEISGHYGGQATCRRCHETKGGALDLDPSPLVCGECHPGETETYMTGLHGGGSAAQVGSFGQGRGQKVGCGACHDAHSLQLAGARIDACQECHQSEHVKNYRHSSHYRYLADPIYAGKKQKGVDCAGCHLPRRHELSGAIDHNEALTISSKERMATDVCSRCHSLWFALTSLHDPIIVESNFTYAPKKTHENLEFLFRHVDDQGAFRGIMTP